MLENMVYYFNFFGFIYMQKISVNNNDYYEKLIFVNRISKTVKGGRIFSFSALTVVGNKNGKVGYGYAKAKEVPLAIQKSLDKSRKNIIFISLNKKKTLRYSIKYYYNSTIIFIKPANEGTGIIAGKTMKFLFEVAGIENILSKCYGSTNPINVIKATFKALYNIQSPLFIANKRGKFLKEIFC